MKEMWDARYSEEGYVYGTEPNNYFKEQLDLLEPGKILLPAEGEGRNAVYAAKCGWKVWAFDQSKVGREKAMRLASQKGLEINYDLGGFEKMDYPEASFDVIGLIYAHFSPALRTEYHRLADRYLKAGGKIILEGFSTGNLELIKQGMNTAGPKDETMLFSPDRIRKEFPGYENLELREEKISFDEGPYHQGTASVIRFLGRKPADLH